MKACLESVYLAGFDSVLLNEPAKIIGVSIITTILDENGLGQVQRKQSQDRLGIACISIGHGMDVAILQAGSTYKILYLFDGRKLDIEFSHGNLQNQCTIRRVYAIIFVLDSRGL